MEGRHCSSDCLPADLRRHVAFVLVQSRSQPNLTTGMLEKARSGCYQR